MKFISYHVVSKHQPAVSLRSIGSVAKIIAQNVRFNSNTELTGFTMYGSIATVARAAGLPSNAVQW